MTTLTVEFEGVTEEVLKNAVKKGYARTKAEVLHAALLQYGRELDLIKPRLHSKAEVYAYAEIKKK